MRVDDTVVSVNDVEGFITGAVLSMNRSNISDDDEDGDGAFGSGQSGQSGGGGGGDGSGGSGDSYGTVKFLGGDEGGTEEPLLPPA